MDKHTLPSSVLIMQHLLHFLGAKYFQIQTTFQSILWINGLQHKGSHIIYEFKIQFECAMMILRWSELNNNLNMSTPNVKDSEDKGGNESNQPLMAHETSGEGNFFSNLQKKIVLNH